MLLDSCSALTAKQHYINNKNLGFKNSVSAISTGRMIYKQYNVGSNNFFIKKTTGSIKAASCDHLIMSETVA